MKSEELHASAFTLNIRVLKLGGVWPHGWSPLFYLYTSLVFIIQFSFFVAEILALGRSLGDMNTATLIVCTMASIVPCLVKIAVAVSNRKDLQRLVTEIDTFVHEQHQRSRHDITTVLHEAHRLARSITLSMLVFGVASSTGWVLNPLLLGGDSALPLVAWYGVEPAGSPTYELLYLSQCLVIFSCFLASWGIDLFLASVMIQIAALLKVVCIRFSLVTTRARTSSTQVLQRIRTPALQEGNLETTMLEVTGTDNMYLRCVQCIQDHQRVIALVKDFENLANPLILTQFLAGIVVICVNLYHTTTGTQGLLWASKFATYLLMLVFQIFIYCWCAHNIMEQGQQVSDAALSAGWPDAPRAVRRALLQVTARAQRRLTITAGRLQPVTRDSFLALINTSYSFYAVLRQLNSR